MSCQITQTQISDVKDINVEIKQTAPRSYSKNYTPLDDLYDERTNNLPISPSLQGAMNNPPLDPDGIDVTDEQYLEIIMKMIEGKKIDLLSPRSLLNLDIYEKLSSDKEYKVDMNTQILMARLRDIHELWKRGEKKTYQMKQLIAELRQTESRVENECGDVFVI